MGMGVNQVSQRRQGGKQAADRYGSGRVGRFFDRLPGQLCGGHRVKIDLQSLVRDDHRRAGGISGDPRVVEPNDAQELELVG